MTSRERAADRAAGPRAVTTAEIEEVLGQVPGVISSRVVADDGGEIRELHVLAGTGRGAKQIVRDIETLLQARFAIVVDHKRISVAQLAEAGPGRRPGRLKLHGLQVRSHARGLDIRVDLTLGDAMSSGGASGPASRSNRVRLPVLATLSAISGFGWDGFNCALEDAAVVTVHQRRAVLVCVSLLTARRREILSGTAYVHGDEPAAAARATLDALNRRLQRFFPKNERKVPKTGE